MIKTDIIIIGAGPVGLFTVFEAGLMKLRCHLIDTIPQIGGQLSELYPKKPIYDIPGFPSILAGKLVENLMEQASPFNPGFTLGERAEKIVKNNDNSFTVITDKNTEHKAPIIIISGGLGSFEPRKPKIDNLSFYEDKGVNYMVKNPENLNKKNIFISGGGDSALDWAIYFAENSDNRVGLIHRSSNFRAHKESVEKIFLLEKQNKIKIYLNSQVTKLIGENNLNQIIISDDSGNNTEAKSDHWFPLFGLIPRLGPILNWGLNIEKNAIVVNNSLDYSTNIKGIFAVGDINTYQGKLKLILCGFHEATVAVKAAYKLINPEKKYVMKYTTIQGVQGFEKNN